MELLDVVVSQADGLAKFSRYQGFCLGHLLVADGEDVEVNVVELQFIALDGLIAALADVGQHRCYGLVQLGNVKVRALDNLGPLFP